MQLITKFQNETFGSVRVATINGEVFFVGKDVAEILGYSNPRKALIDHVDNEDKTDGVTIRDSIGREQQPTFINESGLYTLILSSHMPKARQFKRWVTSEVLPSIRKHGLYATSELLQNPDFLIRALEELKGERAMRKELEMTALIQSQQIAELQPKASYCDIVLSCQDAVNISVIAKDYGMSAKRMNRLLHELGIQFKQGRIWLLYQQYAECGYTKTSTSTYQNSSGQECSAGLFSWAKEVQVLPRKPKTPCSYPRCSRLSEGRFCEEHLKKYNQDYERYSRDKNAKRKYGRAWKRIRDRYIAAHPICEICLEQDRCTKATEVHHKVPLSWGGSHDEANLQSLCHECN